MREDLVLNVNRVDATTHPDASTPQDSFALRTFVDARMPPTATCCPTCNVLPITNRLKRHRSARDTNWSLNMNSTYSAAASLAGSLHGSTEASAQGATSKASATGFRSDKANLFDFVVSSSSFMSVALKTTRADSLFFVLKSTKTTPPSFTSGKAVGETNNSSLLNDESWTKTLTVLVCGSSAGFCSGLVSIFFSCAASLMYKNARSLALRRMRWWL
mmetsp:Transcript_18569/g.52863  ORF Transcript_18569/g.52863 Transcript_18569/m.52863 type:complete len:217 (+) Transcript_18569:611-1261(+)